MKENWIDQMILREATPITLREKSTFQWCKDNDIPKSTYHFIKKKPENQKAIIETILTNAKKYAPEVLNNLGKRGKTDNRAAELYMKFILEFREKTDITSGDKPIPILNNALKEQNGEVSSNDSNKENIESK